ncbi:MAG: restriction endonuclease [Deltaproteobacteria bacterium]|nr:restriction endonuclease [Deltaproteobacteria bacterium]
MAIPDFQTIMLPLLEILGDQKEKSNQELHDRLADVFKLTLDEVNQFYPTGNAKIFYDRISWSKTYLKKALLISSPKRGVVKITNRGLDVLKSTPDKIDLKYLMGIVTPAIDEKTPEEYIEYGYKTIVDTLSKDLLEKIKECPPAFFEKLVIDLLLAMGYGGSKQEAGKIIGKSGDAGIDGIINEDKLGLDSIYVQAKRWEGSVSRPEIQRFAGALAGKRAKKGIFITTSSFTKEAVEYVSMIESRIILIDGEYLAKLMIDHDIGVTKIRSYDLKRIDSDYFIED